jgi:hypothetical protein
MFGSGRPGMLQALLIFILAPDGSHFTPLGDKFQITNFGNFLGAKIGIFTANDKEEKGFVDIYWFRYDAN